ncbi:prohibitin family protein [Imhoffiella purpurea]|uniref:Band 7 protein n=1 Tax=Imhoffiella purpurea TaxID=1249627 RepID=W9UUZ1_9GAMM|nr:prohibitin family protein [Imhoffiella purpurea]EXJ11068.1 band 7 protein [Imhoffiella purpurea]
MACVPLRLPRRSAFQERETYRGMLSKMAHNWRFVRRRFGVFLTFSLLVLLVLGAYFFNRIFINIYPGEAGVLWERLGGGTDMQHIYREGLHIIFPWDKMYVYDTRIQHRPFAFKALSKDGLPIDFEVSVRYFPDRNHLPQLHKTVGPDYVDKVVQPEVQAHLRKVVANYLPDEIYTSEGYLLQIIMQGAIGAFAEHYIVLDDLLIRRMILPKSIVEAIERKLAQEQYVQEYDYRIQREAKEAVRKAIEAEGIKRFQDIVKSSDFFEKYLQYKGIDATLNLASSNNSKVVVVGGGEGGLPLIMNMDPPGRAASAEPAASDEDRPVESAAPSPSDPILPPGVEPNAPFVDRILQYLGEMDIGLPDQTPAESSGGK